MVLCRERGGLSRFRDVPAAEKGILAGLDSSQMEYRGAARGDLNAGPCLVFVAFLAAEDSEGVPSTGGAQSVDRPLRP